MADKTENPINFGTVAGSNPAGAIAKQEGYSGVTIVKNTEIGFTGSNAGASAIFLPAPPDAKTAGSASFANGSSISLGDLAADTMYPFNLASVSASTTTVLVFKR